MRTQPYDHQTEIITLLEEHILQEQLLYESFLDTIKDFAKEKLNQSVTTIRDWKDAAVVFSKVLSDANLFNDFLKPLERLTLKIVNNFYSYLNKLKLTNVVDYLKNLFSHITSLAGWKKFLALISIGGIITYIDKIIKKIPSETISGIITNYFSENFLKDITLHLTDFKSYIGWLSPLIQGTEILYEFLKPLLISFARALQSDSKWATRLVKEESILVERFLNDNDVRTYLIELAINEDIKKIKRFI